MISAKKNAQYLAATLLERGISDIVFSPGSRNAPLINTFTGIEAFRCLNIVDERSAAFFALGMALNLRRPVAVACTSGSAALNYAPAIVEAYYQKAPLLVLTADRPPEWIDQGDGQTIRQRDIYANYIKGSYNLPDRMENKTDEWFAARLLNQAVNDLLYPEMGPVHINVPFAEPLYELDDAKLPVIGSITLHDTRRILPEEKLRAFAEAWEGHPRRMILAGQMLPDSRLNTLLNDLAGNPSVAVLTETLSNMSGERFNSGIDNALSAIDDEEAYRPDLLITLGGQVVSKKIKIFLRNNRPARHWHLSASGEHMDTFMSLTDVVPMDADLFLEFLKNRGIREISDYGDKWRTLDLATRNRNADYLRECAYSDLKAFGMIYSRVPKNSVLHLSNSTPVRYAQLFPPPGPLVFMSNRGTSGIDGVVSTAAGYAFLSDRINTVIVGDLAFFYDSNALWIRHLPPNLRIIVVNNQGGGIFRFIDGAPLMPELENHFEARHHMKAEPLARAFGLNCLVAKTEGELREGLDRLYGPGLSGPVILEVRTPSDTNAEILKDYFKYLRK